MRTQNGNGFVGLKSSWSTRIKLKIENRSCCISFVIQNRVIDIDVCISSVKNYLDLVEA